MKIPYEDRDYSKAESEDLTHSDILEFMARQYDMYSSDQTAMIRRPLSTREKANCRIRADLYESVAAELREWRDKLDTETP